jgi:hypothetical protein
MTETTEHNEKDEHDAITAENDEVQLYPTVGPLTSRRDFLRLAGATAGAAATGGTAMQTAAAQEDGGDATFGERVDVGTKTIKGILTGDYVEFETPMSEDEAANALADNLHDSIYANGVELSMWTDLHHTAIENQLTMLSDFIRTNVQYRVVKEALAEDERTAELADQLDPDALADAAGDEI